MLEKPDILEATLVACLRDAFHLDVARVTFLPLGADYNTAVYRAIAEDETHYFLKLRGGTFDEISVTLPKFLHDQGIAQIITPLTTATGRLWADLDTYKMILYPFVEGHNGNVAKLSVCHWYEFGTALKRIHTATLSPALNRRIRRETFAPQWRERVRMFLDRVKDDDFDDPVAKALAAFLNAKRDEVLDLVTRAERYSKILQTQPRDFVLCHSDVHAWNVFVDDNDAFYIVDWDDPILAPKERDLMFIGGAQGFAGYTAQEEETLFYRGYGQAEIDSVALAYYRYERIVVDIAEYCEQLLLTNKGGKDRAQALHNVKSNFRPNGTIARARHAGKALANSAHIA